MFPDKRLKYTSKHIVPQVNLIALYGPKFPDQMILMCASTFSVSKLRYLTRAFTLCVCMLLPASILCCHSFIMPYKERNVITVYDPKREI